MVLSFVAYQYLLAARYDMTIWHVERAQFAMFVHRCEARRANVGHLSVVPDGVALHLRCDWSGVDEKFGVWYDADVRHRVR
jgi:hypothetical protein